MLPVIKAFMAAHQLADVTVVADAGMVCEANRKATEAAGLSFILGARIPDLPYVVAAWRHEHPDTEPADGQIFTQPWPAGPTDNRRDQVIYYQYKADRARRTLRGIDDQVAKAEKAVAGKAPVKRNRFIRLTGATKTVNRELEAKARALAGFKGYITNIPNPTPEFVLDAYHRLYHIEKSFRMSKHHLAARPIYHHKRESIDAHLTIVFAALASPATSKTAPAGPSGDSSAPPAATAPSTSAPASRPSPPKTPSQPTYAPRSRSSSDLPLRTNLAEVRSIASTADHLHVWLARRQPDDPGQRLALLPQQPGDHFATGRAACATAAARSRQGRGRAPRPSPPAPPSSSS
jgi:hypothetical protein